MLTFGRQNKVTKPSAGPPSSKAKQTPTKPTTKVDPLLTESIVRTNLPAVADPDLSEPTTAEAAIAEQAAQEAARVEVERDADEETASHVTDAQIKKYWRAKEASRKAPRVHQEDLTVEEKMLREWDMSGAYGVSHFPHLPSFICSFDCERKKQRLTRVLWDVQPCIGIARMKRWKRAQKIGLRPPIEVLAVLLREQRGGNSGAQRAHVDELMSSRFVET
jgi:DNA polymerase delta subunit 4